MTTSLNIIFAGTPEFSAPCLQALLDSQHSVIAVLTQPDKPAGRGQKLTQSPIKQLAIAHHIPVLQPITLRDADIQQALRDLIADVMIVAAYGLILPQAVLDMPRYGCINVHASLLPRWRGASPIQSSILHGDKQTGVTIMQMARGMDTGDMLHKAFTDINDNDTAETLHDRLSIMGAQALMETLDHIDALTPEKQDETLVTLAPKILKQDALIDWNQSARAIDCKIRAFNPWPIAFSHLDAHIIRIFKSSVVNDQSSPILDGAQLNFPTNPGTITHADKHGIVIATQENFIRLEQLQLPGGKVLNAADLLHSKQALFKPGKLFK